MKLEDIIKTEKEITEMGHIIENSIIENININTIAHFGNVTCFEIMCANVYPMSNYNNIKNLGYLIRAFIELFDLSREDGLRLTDIKNIPCRIILEGGWGSKCIGFGHFMKNKFVLTDEFVKIDDTEEKRGKWTLKDDGKAHCSLCGMAGMAYLFNYCPNCGAKMDLGEEE